MALLLALAAWLPQAPDSTADPIAFSRWRAETQARLGTAFAPLREAGLLSLEASPALRGLIALATLGLLVRMLDALQATFRANRFQPPPSPPPFQVSVEQTLDDITSLLRRKRFCILREGDCVHAVHFPMPYIGQLAVYLGALLLIVSLAFSAVTGWRTSNLALGVGQLLPLNGQPGALYDVRLDALDSTQRGQVSLLQESETVGTGYVAPSRPVELGGLTIALVDTGPAIRASATLTDGQPLRIQSSAASAPVTELALLLAQDEPDRFFAVPDAELVVRLSRGADAPHTIRAQVYRSRTGTLLFDDMVPSDGQVKVENVALHLKVETYAVLGVTRDPGRPITLIGIVILALGLIISTCWPAAQLWLISSPNETRVIGEADTVQAITSSWLPSTRRDRVQSIIASAGWRIGFVILSAVTGGAVVPSLLRGQPIWPLPTAVQVCVAAWLAGCATLVWKSPARWATLALAVIAAVTMASQPGIATLLGR